MAQRSASELAANAKGNVKKEHLEETGGILLTYLYDHPLIGYLNTNEQPHYVLTREATILEGKEYLLITDQNVIFVEGSRGGDEKVILPYNDIAEVKVKEFYDPTIDQLFVFSAISKRSSNKSTYGFPVESNDHLEEATEYLSNKIEGSSNESELSEKAEKLNKIRKKSSQNGENTEKVAFEANVFVYPEPSGELSEVNKNKLIGEYEEKRVGDGFFDIGPIETSIKYTDNLFIELMENSIQIANSNISIDYENVEHVEFISNNARLRGSESKSLKRADYLRIVVSQYNCPCCENYTGYASEVREHIRKSDDKPHDVDAYIDNKKQNSMYIYLVGKGNPNSDLINYYNLPNVSKKQLKSAESFISKNSNDLQKDMYILNDWIELSADLKIQGMKKGNSKIRGGISGKTETSGKSKGIELGPFTRSKSKSEGSVEANFDARISDNTFTSKIEFIQVDRHGIYVESDPIIRLSYSELDRVLERENGLNIDIGENTYSLTKGNINSRDIENVVSYMTERIAEAREDRSTDDEQLEQTPAEKIQDLNQLYNDGIISEDEFESKKDNLLDEF